MRTIDIYNYVTDDDTTLYVEKKTSRLWEAKLFDGFCLIRPVAKGCEREIKKIPLSTLIDEYDEMWLEKDENVVQFIRVK